MSCSWLTTKKALVIAADSETGGSERKSTGKSKRRLAPPKGRKPPVSFASRSSTAMALPPSVKFDSAPDIPFWSCQPNGDAVGSAGSTSRMLDPSSGLSWGSG
jgi:hypothetical protein